MGELLTSTKVLGLDLASVLGNPLCRCIYSSFIRAKLVASFNVLGLNIRTASTISGLSPPKKIQQEFVETNLQPGS